MTIMAYGYSTNLKYSLYPGACPGIGSWLVLGQAPGAIKKPG
ncbi:unnamed protein product [marine sediment metagenome]|uniref:Uncharacterized protein n=1 Tax=marine sediment metagenome TaxID=412755 RepID=X0UI64_9ZZZZ